MKKGYSILEVLVAMVILTIALPGLVRWVTASRQAQVGSYRSEQATEFAQYVLDSLRQLPNDAISRVPCTGTVCTGIVWHRNGQDYHLKWDYVDPNSVSLPGAVYVEVHWNAGNAKRVSRLDGVLP